MAKKDGGGLKSAFELSMERMAQRGEGLVKLSDEQKKALANVESRTKAGIAQIEIVHGKALADAKAAGDAEKITKIEDTMRSEIRKLKDREEAERVRIRGK